MRFLVLLAGIAASYPALAEENMVGVLTATIAAQVERVATANDIYESVCYASDAERTKGGLPSDACREVGATFNYEMDRLDRLLGAKEAIVHQSAIAAQVDQVDLMRNKYNEACLSPESLQAEQDDLNNDACHFVRAEYVAAVDDLTRLMHGEASIVCTGDDCPEETSDGSN